MKIDARKAAFDALMAITRDGAYTALALKKHIPNSLSKEDKKFASLLLRTTLENMIQIDYVLNKFIKSGRVHGNVRNVLRLGACQILYIDVEDYASVSESVKLVKKIKPQMSGFVNGVLRSLIRDKHNIEYPQGENAMALSIQCSYPEWICEKYIADFGFEFTKSLFSYQANKGTTVRMNTLMTDTEPFTQELKQLSLDYSRGQIEDVFIIKGLSGIENLDIYKNGWMAVQSASAMQAVLQIGLKNGDKLLDCCTAPGGKSAYAVALMQNTLNVTAWDVHEHRVDMTKKNFMRLGVKNAKVELHDATVYEPQLDSSFDVVMVDAPCSAMGLMGKNPDIRYNRKPKDIEELCKIQYSILSTCAKYVKLGGTLAYFTCSINKEENEQVTDKLIREYGFEYEKTPITLYPHINHSDGFYIAIMKRSI